MCVPASTSQTEEVPRTAKDCDHLQSIRTKVLRLTGTFTSSSPPRQDHFHCNSHHPKMTFENFDKIFEYIGGFGRYQMLLFAFGCLLNTFVAIVYCGQIFITLTPPHWCSAPPELLRLNLSEQQLKVLTVPLREDGTDFHTCLRYNVNLTQVTRDNISWPDPSWPLTSCTYGWTYNYSLYYPTITSQMDWVCEDDWRPSMAHSLFFIGSLFGCPTLGWVADRWGRMPTIVFSNFLGAIVGIASAFSSSFIMFIVSRFFIGFIYEQHYTIGFILMLEYVGPQYRTLVSNVPSVFYIGTNCVLPWLAWAVADWKVYAIVIHVPLLLSISFIWIIPESARWLLGQGRVEETLTIIKQAAKVNQKSLPPDVIRDFKVFSAQRTDVTNAAGVLGLLKSPVLRKRFILLCVMWSVSTIAYDAHLRNTENTGYNVFLSFTTASVLELPAAVIAIMSTEWLGRRHTTVWSLVLTGMIGLPVAAVAVDNTVTIMVLAFIARFFISVSVFTGQQYLLEVLPTVVRAQGLGVAQITAFLSTFAAPYIAYSSKFGHYLPYFILGVLTIGGGSVCQLLPETLNENLPDTIEEGETFFTDQSFCYNPCTGCKKATDESGQPDNAGQDNAAFTNTSL